MNPVSHFVLRIEFRSTTTLDVDVLRSEMGIKVRGMTSFDQGPATLCFLQTDDRYRASDIERRIMTGSKRVRKALKQDIYYNTRMDDPSAHIVRILAVEGVGSQKFAEAKHEARDLAIVSRNISTYLDSLMNGA